MFDRRIPSFVELPLVLALAVLAWDSAIAQTSKPHPWIASAPGEFVRLIDRGNVQIAIDDERIKKAGKSALTLFHFVIDYDFKLRHQIVGYDEETMTWRAKVVAWIDQPKVRLEHTICLRSSFTPSSPWESKLLRHEFDHVSISTDPRLTKIIKRTLQQRREWVAEFQQTSAPKEQELRKSIYEKVVDEVKMLEQLVQFDYDLLDEESSHGLSDIQNRHAFFKGLFTVEGLERGKFKLDAPMKAFVKDKLSNAASDKEFQSHYLFLAP